MWQRRSMTAPRDESRSSRCRVPSHGATVFRRGSFGCTAASPVCEFVQRRLAFDRRPPAPFG
jgi:hypothetical protein